MQKLKTWFSSFSPWFPPWFGDTFPTKTADLPPQPWGDTFFGTVQGAEAAVTTSWRDGSRMATLAFGWCDTCGVTWDVGDMYGNVLKMWRYVNMIHVLLICMCFWIPNWLILRLKRVLEVITVGAILTSNWGKEGPGSSYIYLCEILQNKVMKATSEATET